MLLEVDNVTKSFGSLKILKDISFGLERGETKVIMGPSGTGKSTLLRCINYLDPPDGGTVRLDGVTVAEKNINEMRQKISFVFQDFNLFLHLTALDNVAIGLNKLKGLSKSKARSRAEKELERVGMSHRAGSYPAQLSGGQQQRVSIARALAMDPEVILFDEPTSALDPELTGEVIAVMQDLAADGMTMLVVSHEVGFARRAADSIIFMSEGRIVEESPTQDFFDNPEHERSRRFLEVIREQERAE